MSILRQTFVIFAALTALRPGQGHAQAEWCPTDGVKVTGVFNERVVMPVTSPATSIPGSVRDAFSLECSGGELLLKGEAGELGISNATSPAYAKSEEFWFEVIFTVRSPHLDDFVEDRMTFVLYIGREGKASLVIHNGEMLFVYAGDLAWVDPAWADNLPGR